MIFPFLCAVRKHVRNQAVPDVVGKGAKNITGFQPSSGRESEALQTDHSVTAPISEPMVACDYGTNFVTGGVSTRGLFESASRRDDKLIGGKRQLSAHAATCLWRRVVEKSGATLTFGTKRLVRTKDFDDFPLLRRPDESGGLV